MDKILMLIKNTKLVDMGTRWFAIMMIIIANWQILIGPVNKFIVNIPEEEIDLNKIMQKRI